MRHAIVAVAFFLLLCWPLVTAADRPMLMLGVPLPYLYVMGCWAFTVVALAAWSTRPRPKRPPHG